MRRCAELRVGRVALTSLGRVQDALNQLTQACKRLVSGFAPGFVLLRLDHDHAIFGDAPVTQLEQACPIGFGQRAVRNVIAQLNGRRRLVDVLTACPWARIASKSNSSSGIVSSSVMVSMVHSAISRHRDCRSGT